MSGIHPVPHWLEGIEATGRAYAPNFPPTGTPGGRRSAVLMLFGPRDGGGEDVVLTERSASLRKHAGQVSFPGGGVDPGDETPVHTALREAHEEIELDASGVRVLGRLPELPLSVTGFEVTPVVAWWERPGAIRAAEAEVARVDRVAVADLVDPANRFTAIAPGRQFTAPAFEVDGLYIWGFTAILLDAALAMTGQDRPWDVADERVVPERYRRR